jgi:hypothetical protein
MPRFFGGDGRPLARPEDIIPLLGKGALHWKKGRSAFEAAQSWCRAAGLPPAIRAILATDPLFADAHVTKTYFERTTQLDNTGRGPSQTDVLAFLETCSGVAVLGVEAKVDETFGPYVSEWLDGSPGKTERLTRLARVLRIENDPGRLRYQLLHRTVATILEARQAGATEAIMLVQSFSPATIRAGFTDFQFFAQALMIPIAGPGVLSKVCDFDGTRLRLGWTENDLSAPDVV